jgi:hypothetical protein
VVTNSSATAISVIKRAADDLDDECARFVEALWKYAAHGEAGLINVLEDALGDAPSYDRAVRRSIPRIRRRGGPALAMLGGLAILGGARGVVILLDDAPSALRAIPAWLEPRHSHPRAIGRLLALAGKASRVLGTDVMAIDALGKPELGQLARAIRDLHVRAYPWPQVATILDSSLAAFAPAACSTRDFVRGVVYGLDTELERVSAELAGR